MFMQINFQSSKPNVDIQDSTININVQHFRANATLSHAVHHMCVQVHKSLAEMVMETAFNCY